MKGLQLLEQNNPAAVELFSAGWCNLDCSYCYIPKDDKFLFKFHRDIIRKIKNGEYIKEIKQVYGDNITAVSHWGTEPTLTLPIFKNFYKEAVKEFPKLNTISFSSNFMTDPTIIPKFIEYIKELPINKNFKIDVQMSLDGPKWITDKNRKNGSTEKIIENIIKFIELLNKEKIDNIQIRSHFKPTATKEDHVILSENDDVLEDYYRFFDDVFDRMIEANKNKNINFPFECNPSIVVPQNFSKSDGLVISKMYDKQIRLRQNKKFKHVFIESPYFTRFLMKINPLKHFNTKPRMFSCSAGDTCFGLDADESLIPCHRLFYLNDSKYVDMVTKYGNDEVTVDDISSLNNLKNNYTASINKQEQITKVLYLTRGFNDFNKLKTNYQTSIIRLLAQSDQISKCYDDEGLAELLSTYTLVSMACPMENILHSGSINISMSPLFKLFGNGLAEKVFWRIFGGKRNC